MEYISRDQEYIDKFKEALKDRYKIEFDWYLDHVLHEAWNAGARFGLDRGP